MLALDELSVLGRLNALAQAVVGGDERDERDAAVVVQERIGAGGDDGGGRSSVGGAECGAAEVRLSPTQVGLVALALARQLGVDALLVDSESGLLLRVRTRQPAGRGAGGGDGDGGGASGGDEPSTLYMGVEAGETFGRTMEESECIAPAVQLILLEDVPEDHHDDFATEVDDLCLVGSLAAEWSEAYLHAGMNSLAAFWAVQHLTLERLSNRISAGGLDGDDAAGLGGLVRPVDNSFNIFNSHQFTGRVVRVDPPDEDLDYGI